MSTLFSPLKLRELTLTNRIVISPMCQHAAERGRATAWHLVHLGKFALGGAGLILTESTTVDPRGRIGTADLGDAERWQRLGPSAIPAGLGWSAPTELDAAGIEAIVQRFVDATLRADRAGFDVVELHFGHGYLVASFLSPNANYRQDEWGVNRAGRMRLALTIARRVRAVWPAAKPLFCRISSLDGSLDGWNLDDSVVLARELAQCGVDVVDCSSGGLTEETRALPVPRGLGFQVPFSARIRREAGVATQTVGMIVDAHQAEAVLAAGDADLVALGREALFDPYWPHHAAAVLGADPGFARSPLRHGVWLAKRAPGLAKARAAGDPLNDPLE